MKLLDFLWWFLDLDKSSSQITAAKQEVKQQPVAEPANNPDSMAFEPVEIEAFEEYGEFFD